MGQYIYAVAEQVDGEIRVHAVDVSTGVESSGGYPSTLGYGSFADAEIIGGSLIIAHSGSNVSKVALNPGSYEMIRDRQLLKYRCSSRPNNFPMH